MTSKQLTQLCSTGCKSVARNNDMGDAYFAADSFSSSPVMMRTSGSRCRRRPNRRLFRPDAFLKMVLEVGGGFGEGLRISAGFVARDAGPIEGFRGSEALGEHPQNIFVVLLRLDPFLTGKIGVSQP